LIHPSYLAVHPSIVSVSSPILYPISTIEEGEEEAEKVSSLFIRSTQSRQTNTPTASQQA